MGKIKAAIFLVFIVFGFHACDTAGDFDTPYVDYFSKFYGSSNGNQTAVDMVVNEDGTVIVVGKSEANGIKRTYFLKVDLLGNTMAEKYISGPTDEVIDIEPLGSDEFVILSNFINESTNGIDIKLLKVNSLGEVLDTVVADAGGNGNDVARSLTILSDGRIVVSGSTDFIADNNSQNPDLGDFLAMCFLPNLDVDTNWNFEFSSGGYNGNMDVITKILESEDPSLLYAMGFSSTSLIAGNSQEKRIFIYFSLDNTGIGDDIASPKGSLIEANDTDVLSAIKLPAFSPGYFVTGVTKTSAGSELFVSKLRKQLSFDAENDVEIFSKIKPAISSNLTGISVAGSSVAPQGYLIVGNDVKPAGTTDIWLCKMDLSGQIIWSGHFGSETGDDVAGAVAELPDGKILVLGSTELGDNQRKVSLTKLNAKGQLLK
jgi:hypothetical protein